MCFTWCFADRICLMPAIYLWEYVLCLLSVCVNISCDCYLSVRICAMHAISLLEYVPCLLSLWEYGLCLLSPSENMCYACYLWECRHNIYLSVRICTTPAISLWEYVLWLLSLCEDMNYACNLSARIYTTPAFSLWEYVLFVNIMNYRIINCQRQNIFCKYIQLSRWANCLLC